ELGYLDDPDDVFDDVTEAAVKDFQQANSLTADGMVGKNTKEALYNPDCVAKAYGFGDSGEKVLTYQQRLQELGYLTTEPDGVYGNDTKMAVRRFQMQNELIEDGYLGPVTREKLMSDDAVGNALSITMSGSDVLNVQVRLSELNYLRPSDVNSYFTSVTEEAVRLFQRNNNLLEDGKVGRNTMSVLFSENAVRAVHPVNTPTAVPTNAPRPTATPRPTNPPSGGGGGGNGGGGSVQQRINTMISVARSKLGCRYVRGHKGPNTFDCSGFVWWVLNHSGVSIGYMTTYYWRTCQRFTRIYNINNIKRGDVVLFNGHIAICSNTWTIIDASHSNGKVVERSFNRNWFKTNFVCGFRIFK
ncbi:MAG: peptidoglycan-binding protein, partial [Clostridia bacterium]|nr:peptidoglycan-binding protein [Clostridia bacterium]